MFVSSWKPQNVKIPDFNLNFRDALAVRTALLQYF